MDSINLGGEIRPIRCSWLQLKKLARKKGIKKFREIGEALADMDMDEIPWFAHQCLKDAAEKEGDVFDYTKEQVEEWLDDAGFSSIEKFFTVIADSMKSPAEVPGKLEEAVLKQN